MIFKLVVQIVVTVVFSLAIIEKVNTYTEDTFATILILAIGFYIGVSIVAIAIRFSLL